MAREESLAKPAPFLDVARLIDERPLTALQKRVFVLCALVALLDGADTQSIGVAAPFIASGIGMPMNAFGPIFAAALFGAMAGALTFGPLADRFGRKTILIAATVTFAIFTFATAFANSYVSLFAYRFLAGIGLGGATPCFIALTAEYAPARMRNMIVTAQWAAFPLGGMLGGLLNAYIVATHGWRALFYAGGVLPLALALALAVMLPESLRFLAARRHPPVARIAPLIHALTGRALEPGTLFPAAEEALPGLPVKYLFAEGRALRTLILWIPFFMGFGLLSVVTLWTPALMREQGVAASSAAIVVSFNGLGAIFGQGFAGRLIDRFGALPVLVPAFLFAAPCAVGLGAFTNSVVACSIFIGLVGLFAGLGTAGAIALAARAYPTSIRSTGVGWAMGMGRLGQALLPIAVGTMLGLHWGARGALLMIAIAPLIAALFVTILCLRAPPASQALPVRVPASGL